MRVLTSQGSHPSPTPAGRAECSSVSRLGRSLVGSLCSQAEPPPPFHFPLPRHSFSRDPFASESMIGPGPVLAHPGEESLGAPGSREGARRRRGSESPSRSRRAREVVQTDAGTREDGGARALRWPFLWRCRRSERQGVWRHVVEFVQLPRAHLAETRLDLIFSQFISSGQWWVGLHLNRSPPVALSGRAGTLLRCLGPSAACPRLPAHPASEIGPKAIGVGDTVRGERGRSRASGALGTGSLGLWLQILTGIPNAHPQTRGVQN
jgi:hypothetical protein